jgi:hypothetical protein
MYYIKCARRCEVTKSIRNVINENAGGRELENITNSEAS